MEYFQLILVIIFIISAISFFSLAPWVPTKRSDLERINNIINIKPWEKFLEMWCWTASVSIYIAKNNPYSFITWIELSPLFYIISRVRLYISGINNIEIKYWNALNLVLEDYDIIYIFGLPETIIKKVFPKLSKIVNKDFRFISYCFKMTNNYFKETKYKNEWINTIYKYKL